MMPLTRALLLLIALWLPVQGYAAAVMAACRQVPPSASMAAEHAHHAMTVSSDHARHDGVIPGGLGNCDNCQFCHICSAQAITAAPAIGTPLPRGLALVSSPVRLSSPTLEGPRRPPRSARS